MQELIKKIKENNEKVAELTEIGEAQLKEFIYGLPDWLKTKEHIHAICWNQYIPGFNDGDPCVFRVNGVCLITDKSLRYDLDCTKEEMIVEAIEDYQESDDYYFDSEETDQIKKLINDNSDLALQALFGENAQIIITKDGVRVDDYDCGY